MYFLSCMLEGDCIDPGSFLARQLYSVATSTNGRIVIGGIITSIAWLLGIKPNPDDRVRVSERHDKAAFELMVFCQVEAGRFCWIYLAGWLMPLFPILNEQHWHNFLYLHSDEKLAHPAPLVPPPSFIGPSFSSQQPYPDYGDIGATLRSI